MPIQTQGHQVQVMPTYTPMDPRLVTTDFGGLTRGALSSIELANELSKRKAFLAQQAEEEAIRQGRIGATNVRNQSIINVLPKQDLASIALAEQQAQVIPMRTPGMISDIQFADQQRPMIQETRNIEAMFENINAAKKGKTSEIQADAEAEAAPIEADIRLRKARQQLDSITNNPDLTDQEKLAHIRLLSAQSAKAEAEADYTARNKPKAGSELKTVDGLQKQLSHIETSIKRLEAQKVLNPNLDNEGMPVPIQQYQGATRDANGNLIVIPHFFGPDERVKTNPDAEKISAQLDDLYKLREKYNNDLTDLLLPEGQATPQISVGGSPAQGAAAAGPIKIDAATAPVAPAAVTPPSAVLTPDQAAKLPKGTVFTGTDGKQHIRK